MVISRPSYAEYELNINVVPLGVTSDEADIDAPSIFAGFNYFFKEKKGAYIWGEIGRYSGTYNAVESGILSGYADFDATSMRVGVGYRSPCISKFECRFLAGLTRLDVDADARIQFFGQNFNVGQDSDSSSGFIAGAELYYPYSEKIGFLGFLKYEKVNEIEVFGRSSSYDWGVAGVGISFRF